MISIQKDKIIIRYYQNIMALDNNVFVCKMNNNILSITGKNLQINYYGPQEILLSGQLRKLEIT